jgi:hypothetical protein
MGYSRSNELCDGAFTTKTKDTKNEAKKMNANSTGWACHATSTFQWVWLVLVFMLSATSEALAQQDTIPQRGFHPAGSYALTDLETINTRNGNLIFRIPLVSLPAGRGGTPGPTVNLYYNSKLWDTFVWVVPGEPNPADQNRNELVQSPDGGWRYALSYELRLDNRLDHFSSGGINCPVQGSDNIYKLEMSFPDGSVREFRPRGYSDFYGDGYFNIRPDLLPGAPVPPA